MGGVYQNYPKIDRIKITVTYMTYLLFNTQNRNM